MDQVIRRLADRWGINTAFLKDIYLAMLNDPRFASSKSVHSIRYAKMSKHLEQSYRVELEPYKLKYLVLLIRSRKR